MTPGRPGIADSAPDACRRSREEILADAVDYCRDHGLKLTSGRRGILEAITAIGKAVKAYDLLAAVTKPGSKLMPPVVYRALDFWIEHGFVHRIESLNSFIACGHPLHSHGCQILVCTRCGRVDEVCDPALRQQFRDTAASHGFNYSRSVLEIHGTCPACT